MPDIKRMLHQMALQFHNQEIKFKILSLYLAIVIASVVTVSVLSYISTEKQLKQNIYFITNEMVNQINRNISDKLSILTEQLVKIKFDERLERITNLNGSGLSEREKTEAILYFKKIFDDIYSFGNNYQLIHSMIVYLDNGMVFHFEQGKYYFLSKKLSAAELSLYYDDKRNYYWMNVHTDATFFRKPGVRVLSLSAPIRKGGALKALVIVNMNESYIKKLIENINLDNAGSVVMVSEDGELVSRGFDRSPDLEGMIREKVLHGADESGRFEYQAHKVTYLVIYGTIGVNGWRLAAIFQKADLMRDIVKAKRGILYFTLLITLLAAVAAFIVAYGLTKPINKLSQLMSVVETGNLDIRFNTRYNDEIGKLTRQFNSMLERIKLLISEVEREQTEKRKIELRTLQMQINPHFLYNTLESIKFLAEQKSDDTGEMVRALGQFYRRVLSKEDGTSTVAEEIDHLQSYLTIQKIRYSTRFDYRIEVEDKSLLGCETVKFILQPLVENAIHHGIRKKRGKGLIVVKVSRENASLNFTVFDNGAGIAADRLGTIRENLQGKDSAKDSGIGVCNVHKRIVMNYGEGYGVAIESAANEFTAVKVRLPLIPAAIKE
jgi:two-component system sensor histidine kinase YesM